MCTQFLFVQDGSVDVDDLKATLSDNVKVVVYRQGSTLPIFISLPTKESKIDSSITKTSRYGNIAELEAENERLTKELAIAKIALGLPLTKKEQAVYGLIIRGRKWNTI